MIPKVSIITITYNKERFIKEAIDSVLRQSFGDFEMIIIDNASTDKTSAIVNDYLRRDKRLRFIVNKTNLKIPRSRNQGLREARGKYIATLDSDDVWVDNDKLKKQVNFLENQPEYALIGSGFIVIDEIGKELFRRLNPTTDLTIRKVILSTNPFAHSSTLFLREAALKAGGYDENLEVGEDYDLWLKLGKFWKFANLGEYLVKYRIHPGGITFDKRLQLAKTAKASIQKYKAIYPNYYKGLLITQLRLIFYWLL